MKSMLYRIFGLGRIPGPARALLAQEGCVVLDEGLRCSLGTADLRTPTKIRKGYRRWFCGAVALTNARFMAFEFSRRCINIPFADERFRRMRFAQEGRDTLVVEFDAALFHGDWVGMMTFRFHTPQVGLILRHLRGQPGSGDAGAGRPDANRPA